MAVTDRALATGGGTTLPLEIQPAKMGTRRRPSLVFRPLDDWNVLTSLTALGCKYSGKSNHDPTYLWPLIHLPQPLTNDYPSNHRLQELARVKPHPFC